MLNKFRYNLNYYKIEVDRFEYMLVLPKFRLINFRLDTLQTRRVNQSVNSDKLTTLLRPLLVMIDNLILILLIINCQLLTGLFIEKNNKNSL